MAPACATKNTTITSPNTITASSGQVTNVDPVTVDRAPTDSEFLPVIGRVNELLSPYPFGNAKVYTGTEIAQELGSQASRLIDRFGFDRKYEIKSLFTYGENPHELIAKVEYPSYVVGIQWTAYIRLDNFKMTASVVDPVETHFEDFDVEYIIDPVVGSISKTRIKKFEETPNIDFKMVENEAL